jgi:hypothetical protein
MLDSLFVGCKYYFNLSFLFFRLINTLFNESQTLSIRDPKENREFIVAVYLIPFLRAPAPLQPRIINNFTCKS